MAEAYQIFDYMLNWKSLPDVVAYYVLENSMGFFKQPRLSSLFSLVKGYQRSSNFVHLI